MSAELTNLFQNGDLVKAIWETVYMTFGSTIIAYLLGLPLGILLYVTDKKGICPCGRRGNHHRGSSVSKQKSAPVIKSR